MEDLRGIVPMRLRDADPAVDETTGAVVDAGLEVQRALGPGLLEKPYELALAHELALRGLRVRRQVPVATAYKGLLVPDSYRLDLVVDERVVVELKAGEDLCATHAAQLATYLRFSGLRVGLLINFHAMPLKTGIRRVVRTT